MKKYLNISFIYAIVAMICGVFYREFTKYSEFTGKTNLSVMHTHYFMLGMFFFLILLLLEKNFSFSEQKNTGKIIVAYNIGLNITGAAFFVRGLTQVWGTNLSKGMDSAISGIAGLGHIILGVSIILLFLRLKKVIAK